MKWRLREKVQKIRKNSLKSRLLFRVLAPPFLLLLVLGLAGFWQLDGMARSSAVDSLRRASVTTAAKLEREFSLRQTVLRSTGTELFTIKQTYADKRLQLDRHYATCRQFLLKSLRFTEAPDDSCHPFAVQLAFGSQTGMSLAKAVDTDYGDQVKELTSQEQDIIRSRLDAFVEFFPETVALVVTDSSGAVISQALSKQVDVAMASRIDKISSRSLKQSVEGEFIENNKQRELIFGYPIENGSVIAAYNLDHANFLAPSWQDTPIDQQQSYVAIANSTNGVSYPKTDNPALYEKVFEHDKKDGSAVSFTHNNVDYLSVAEQIGKSNWSVVVGSPAVIALDSLINAQIVAVIIIGLLLVSFLWVGSLFVNRTIKSILILSGSAHTFSSGNLAYRINPELMDDEEFAHLAITLNDMASRIQEAEQAIDQKNKEFISVATHEIKAPITAVIGNLSMLLDDGMGQVDDTARKLAGEAYRGTIRLRDLVNELLDTARIESGRAQFNLTPLDLKNAITEMVKLQQITADGANIAIRTELSDDLPDVIADPSKLDIILTNFISNAIKYNQPNGSVTISCAVQGSIVEISVADTGLGIPADQKSQMFQKFFRVENADRRGVPGTGLGMYITKQFIEAMGGRLWFESTHGEGTTFHFTLPVANSEDLS